MNCDFFMLTTRLEQVHSDWIEEIILKCEEYPREYVEHLVAKGYSQEEILRLIMGTYVKPEDFNLRPLSKITYDLISRISPELLKGINWNE